MQFRDAYKFPFWLAGVAGPSKSFVHNPILGSARLNRHGLHRDRVRIAAQMATSRRRRLARHLDQSDRDQFDRDGLIIKHDYLPADQFARLTEEVRHGVFPAREMRQGQTVTRMTPLTTRMLAGTQAIGSVVRDQNLRRMIHYAASYGGEPIMFLQTVIADPTRKTKSDPQTDLHSDTFHPSAKAWLFLHDVGEEDGPLMFVPGSHKVNAARLAWEHENSLTAREDARRHHAMGSFRITPDELDRLELGPPVRVAVPANTLVIADTYGFHGRTPSTKSTMRLEIHGHLRRNPFLPWTGLHPLSLPGIRGRELDIFLGYSDLRERYLKQPTIWRPVGAVAPDAPPNI